MKILVVTSKFQPEYSGSGLRAHNTYKRLSKNYEIEYDVLTSSIENRGTAEYFYENIKITRVAGYLKVSKFKGIWRKLVVWFNLPFEIYSSFKYIKGRIDCYDILHTFGDSWSVGFFTWYFNHHNKPVMRELCNEIKTPYFPYPFRKLIKKIFNNDNMLMVAISPKLESLAKKHSVRQVWQRPNPIDKSVFNIEIRGRQMELRSKLTPFSNKDIVLTYVAMFWRNKNQLFLLRLLSKLNRNFKLVLAGPVTSVHENYFKDVLLEISRLNLNSRVHIVDKFIDNPQEYIAMSDAYLFPSRHEGLGTPILEAQACGVPIIINKMPGISDKWVDEGKAGYIANLDEEEWIKKIKKAILIDKSNLSENSAMIASLAGSNKIDKEYFQKFNNLCSANEK